MEQIKYSYVPIVELDRIRQGMAQVEKILNNKNLTEKQRQNFQNLFSTLTREFSNYSTLLQRGFKKDIDVSNIDKAGVKIEKIINNILTDYQGIDFNVLAKGFQASTNRAKELRETLTDIKKQIKDVGGQDLKVKGNAALTKMSTVSSSSNIEKFRKGLNEGDVASMNEAYNALKANEKRFSTEKGAAYSTELAKLKSILDQIAKNPAMKQLTQDLDKVEAELQNINKTELNKLIQKFKQGKVNTKQFLDSMRKLGVTTRQVGQEQVAYNQTLESFKNKIKYFVSLDTVLRLIRRTIRDAYESVKELDAVMTQTAVVSEYTVGEMWETLPEKTAQANKYGVTIKGVYEVETLYYQQGLKANEVTAVGAETLKMAKISGLDYAAATDAMTAALRGFNMEVNQMNAQKVNDVYSALAAYTASDVEELSTAMTKTASISASAGMEFANTSAFLAKIIETTRESAETAGTAMKTIVARFTEIKNNPNTFSDENGEIVDVNKIDTALASVGVSLKDTEGQIRNLDDVFLDLAKIWDTLDKNTQRYIATIAAGSRQQSRFIAMMSDYERTMELVSIANNSAGASQEQFEKTMDSLEYKTIQLKNAWDQFIQSLANNTVIKMTVDILTGVLNAVNALINGFGLLKGGVGSFAIALTILYNTFKALKKVTTMKFNLNSPLMKMLMGKPEGSTQLKGEVEQGVGSAANFIREIFRQASYQGTKQGVEGAQASINKGKKKPSNNNNQKGKDKGNQGNNNNQKNNKKKNQENNKKKNQDKNDQRKKDQEKKEQEKKNQERKEREKKNEEKREQEKKKQERKNEKKREQRKKEQEKNNQKKNNQRNQRNQGNNGIVGNNQTNNNGIVGNTNQGNNSNQSSKKKSRNKKNKNAQSNNTAVNQGGILGSWQTSVNNVRTYGVKGTGKQISQNFNSYFAKGKPLTGKNMTAAGKTAVSNYANSGGLSSYLTGAAIGIELASSIISKAFDPNNDKNRNKEERTEEIYEVSKRKAEATENELKQITQVSDSYKDQIATMRVADKSTKEYIQAQKEANKLIRNIIKNNPELKDSKNLEYKNGNYTVKEGFWEEYEDILIKKQAEADKQEAAADYANQLAQYEDQRDNSGVGLDTISDKEAKNIQTHATTASVVGGAAGALGGMAMGMAIGAAAGTVVPIVGNIVGAIVGGVIGLVGGLAAGGAVGGIMTAAAKNGYSAEKVDKYTERISTVRDELTNEDIENLANGQTEGYEDIVNAMGTTSEEVKEFFNVYKDKATELNNLLSKKTQQRESDRDLTNKLVENSDIYEKYGDDLKAAFTDEEAAIVGDKFEQAITDFKNLGAEDATKLTYEQKAMSQLGFKKVGDKYYNEEGQEVSKDVAQEAAAQMYAADKAQEYVNSQGFILMKRQENMMKSNKSIGSYFYKNEEASLAAAKGINRISDAYGLDQNQIGNIWAQLGEDASLAFTYANSETEAGMAQFISLMEQHGIDIVDNFGMDADALQTNFIDLGLATEDLSLKVSKAADAINLQSKIQKGEGITATELATLSAVDASISGSFKQIGDLFYYTGESLEAFSKEQILDAQNALFDYADKVVNNQEGYDKETLTKDAMAAGTADIFLDKELYTEAEAKNYLIAMARSLGATDIDIQEAKTLEGLKDLVNKLKLNKINEYNEELTKTLKEKIYNAIVYERQKEIDRLTEENNNIEESNQKVLEEIRNSVDKIRQDRENDKREQEITDKQLELAYLKADTNASTADIIALEEEIANSQESYIDTLIDQQLDNFEEANKKSADQRKAIIQKLTDSLAEDKKTGKIWTEVKEKIDSVVNSNNQVKIYGDFVEMLKESAGYDSMSEEEKKEWADNLKTATGGLLSLRDDDITNNIEVGDPANRPTTSDNNGLKNPRDNSHKTPINEGTGNLSGFISLGELDLYQQVERTNGNSFNAHEVSDMEKKAESENGVTYYPIMDYNAIKETSDYYIYKDRRLYFPKNNLIKDEFGGGIIEGGTLFYQKFKKGGLNTTTGPAWLDGTPSNPEMVLNARDTKNFIQLKDILGNIMSNSSSSSQMTGDNYFDININVESISSDYDVERLSEKIKNEINNDARYRNVNSINLVR